MTNKADPNSGPRRRLAQLRASFKNQLSQMIEKLKASWGGIRAAPWTSETSAALNDIYGLVHRVTGSAGSFGFPAVSRVAAPLEALLGGIRERNTAPSLEERDQIDVFIDRLVETWANGDNKAAQTARNAMPPSAVSDPCLIYLIGEDAELADFIRLQLEQFGYRIKLFTTPEAIVEAMSKAVPAAVLADVELPSKDSHYAVWLEKLAEQVAVILITERSDISSRLAAVWARCSAYLVKPVEINDLVDWLDRLTQRLPTEPYYVLIVDDDEYLAESYALVLKQAGIDTAVLSAPMLVLEKLAERQPDLILMDVYMPECNGIDLVQVVRQYWAYLSIPIVFLSIEQDISRQLAMKCVGGDDFLCKPIDPEQLVNAVLSRAERARVLRNVMESDSLTGLLNHVSIKERLAVEVARAQRQGLSLTLALIDLDNFKTVNDRFGHMCGDRVLKALTSLLTRRLRKTDIIGRYGGEEFAVIFTHTYAELVVKVMNELCESFARVRHSSGQQEFSVTLSCGVAAFEGVNEAADLIIAADKALYAAKMAGRNQVVRS